MCSFLGDQCCFLHECVSFNENVFFYELCINWKLYLVKLTYPTTNLYSSWIALDEENSINVYTYVTSFSFSLTANHASSRKKAGSEEKHLDYLMVTIPE